MLDVRNPKYKNVDSQRFWTFYNVIYNLIILLYSTIRTYRLFRSINQYRTSKIEWINLFLKHGDVFLCVDHIFYIESKFSLTFALYSWTVINERNNYKILTMSTYQFFILCFEIKGAIFLRFTSRQDGVWQTVTSSSSRAEILGLELDFHVKNQLMGQVISGCKPPTDPILVADW